MCVDLMMDLVTLKFRGLLKPLMIYEISKIFRYDFNWESQTAWISFLSKTLLLLI